MSVSRVGDKLRVQVYDPEAGRARSAFTILGRPGQMFPDNRQGWRDARKVEQEATDRIAARTGAAPTVAQFRDRWLTDPLFARAKQSTMYQNGASTRLFAEQYGALLMTEVDDRIVGEWLRGGRRNWTVKALRAMFGDAASAKAGRIVPVNPFARLGLERTKGNEGIDPPSQEQMALMIQKAGEVAPPSFAAWLEFACVTGIRPSECDALRWDDLDREAGEIHVRQQFSAVTRTFTLPKYGPYTAVLPDRALEIVDRMPLDLRGGHYVFTTINGTHWTTNARTKPWNRVRKAAGLEQYTLYLATRHYFGWYAMNVLELDSRDIAEALGHRDGGRLVERLYGHPDRAARRAKVRAAFNAQGKVRPLRSVS